MKILILNIFTLFLISSCNFEEAAEDAGGGLFSGHKEIVNSFVQITSSDQTYTEGENIDLVFKHPSNLTVTGTPRVEIDIDGSTKYATYLTGSSTQNLTFRYTVQAGDNDSDGIEISSSLDLNGGSIKFSNAGSLVDADLNYETVDEVQLNIDTVSPSLILVTPPNPTTYLLGQSISFIAIFDDFVSVSGTPRLQIDIGGVTAYADYVSGDSTTSLIFRYIVTDGDQDLDGITMTSPIDINGGSITDGNGNISSLTFPVLPMLTTFVDGDTPTITSMAMPTSKTYVNTEFIEFSLTYSEIINVTGLPRIAFDLGGVTKYLNYDSGSGTKTLTFDYLVSPGDDDTDGITIGNIVDLNSGTIQDGGGTNATLDIAPPLTPSVLVDAGFPMVSSITLPTDKTYLETEELFFTLNFDKSVNITGTPQISLETTSSSPGFLIADYVSGSGTQNIVFRYTVANNDSDLDGIELQNTIDLNSGTIIGDNTINADLDMTTAVAASITTGILIDAAPASITSITPPADNSYITGNEIDFVVNFSKLVNITNTPRIELNIGGVTQYADYLSGTGSNAITFRYTVQATDSDGDGIAISNTSIDLNTSGTIQDANLEDADLDMSVSIPTLTGVIIFLAPVTITAVTPPADNTYIETNVLSITLATSENVDVVGAPRIQLDIGGTTKYADYISGTGTSSLVFSYTVEAGLEDTDGILLVTPLELNSGTIKNGSLQDMGLGYTLPVTTAVLVDSIVPVITSVTPPADATYNVTQNLDFTINTDESIDVVGSPRIQIDIGGTTKYADYLSGTGTSSLIFRYTLEAGLYDNDGISIVTPLELNGGTLLNTGLEPLDLNFTQPSLSAVLVDSDVPEVTSITPPADTTYLETQTLTFTVNLDEMVNVTVATPRLQIDIGGTTKYANLTSGSGTAALVFEYVVEAILEDLDGIELVSPIDLNGAVIQNASLENLDLTFTPPTMAAVLVDSSAPVVAITSPSDLSYINSLNDSSTFPILGTCDEAGQTVSIEVDSLAASSPINFLCDGANFSGTIDTTGLTEAPHTLTAKLLDTSTNEGISGVINLTKDVTVPEINLLAAPADAYYLETQNLDFNITLSEAVTIIGTPRIQLDISGGTKYSNLNSGSGTTSLIFRYTVVNTDEDHDGLAYASTSLDANGATLEDSAGNSLDLDMALNNALPSLTAVYVDGVVPTITITSSPDITSANELTYMVSGTCSDDGRTINVSIDGSPYTPICSSNSWAISPSDVSAILDNPAISVTADLSDIAGNNAVQASTTVSKDTATPMVAITSSPDIDSSNHTAYTVSGTCTDNGVIVDVNIDSINIQPNCSGGTWTTGNVDVSGLIDNATLPITADHNSATQASTTVDKDLTSSVITISSSPNISSANELSYIASGTCSDNGQTVTVNIGIISQTPTCSGGSWTTGNIDVSSLADSASIGFTADHMSATQAVTTISKNTATPTVASLSAPTTLTNSVDMNWSLNDPGGFTINDYEVNYRIKNTPTWLSFNDGVSTDTSATVDSLVASTTYEFRVRVQYDTTEFSDWSNTAEAETKPDDPLFSSPYAAMNVGGATSTSVVAYYDNTIVTLDGTPIPDSPLSKGQTSIIATSQFQVLDADKPIFAAGILGSGTGGSGANMVWMPTSWAGKSFSFNSTRANPQNLFIFATENASITLKQGSTVLTSTTLTAGTGTTLNWSVYGSYQVVSTGTILAYHMSGSGTTRYDPKPILPGHTEIIGFASGSMRLTGDLDSTNYNVLHGNSVTASGNLDKQDVVQINSQGTSSYYQGYAVKISADRTISGASFADSNGLCAAPFIPTNLLKKRYITNADANYVAFASKQAGTIAVYTSAQTIGVDPPLETLTLTRAGADPNAPYNVRRDGTTPAGYRFVSTVPVGAWYHPSVEVGSAAYDETILYGTDDE